MAEDHFGESVAARLDERYAHHADRPSSARSPTSSWNFATTKIWDMPA
jgi:hypothetical protein